MDDASVQRVEGNDWAKWLAPARALHKDHLAGTNDSFWQRDMWDTETIFVLTLGPDLAGYLVCELHDGCAILHELVVATQFRGRRFGTLLLESYALWVADQPGIAVLAVQPLSEAPLDLDTYYRARRFHAPDIDGHLQATAPEVLEAIWASR